MSISLVTVCGVLGAPVPPVNAAELTSAPVVDGGPAQHVCGYSDKLPVPEHPAPVDCSESQDTGYTQGDPFSITVVHIDNKPVEKDTANAYWVMREAAAADGVDIHIVSGFRTNAEQQYLYNCYINCNCNNCNLAAKPGFSNHQSGHALDLNSGGAGVYSWLDSHAGAYGFTETVPGEPWHWEWWGGGPGGGICDITSPPDGVVDQADCGVVRGWAQDPDHPDAPIEVHVYFGGPAGDPDAVGVTVVADEYRADLCEPLGSCEHAFEISYPLSLMDGAPRPVHVYAIDLDGDGNPQIGVDEGVTCPAPPLPMGARRHVPTTAAVEAWGFDLFHDRYVVDDVALEALPEWVAIAPAPTLITADQEPSPGVWLLDAGVRRHVPSPAVAAAWGFALDSVETLEAAAFEAIEEGTALRPYPRLVQATGSALYLIDDAQVSPAEPDDGGTPGATTGTTGDPEPDPGGVASETDGGATSATGPAPDEDAGDDAGGDDEPTDGGALDDEDVAGCTCRAGEGEGGGGWLLWPALLLAALRRRRRVAVLLAPGAWALTATGCYTGSELAETRATTSDTGGELDGSSSSGSTSEGEGEGESESDGVGTTEGDASDSEGALDCEQERLFFADSDGDGYGRDDMSIEACAAPPGYVEAAGDCDDANAHVNPDALEDCNERDDDCDGLLDERSSINAVCGACWLFEWSGERAYWVCEAPVAWAEAQARCRGFGAELASVRSEEENELLRGYADKGVNLFLGLNDLEVEGEHVWSDGSPVEYTRWNEGEPNDSQDAEDCVELKSGAGVWNDISCEAQRYFVCAG